MVNDSQHENNFFANLYLNRGYKTAVELAFKHGNLNGWSVLDYGCGTKRLLTFLPKYCTYVGYDKNPEYSDVENINGFHADAVFCLSTLCFLTKEELVCFSKEIASKKPVFLVVSVPCEYFTNKLLRFLFAKDFANEVFHNSHWIDVGKALLKDFELVEVKRVCLMQWVTVWKPRSVK